MFQMSSICPTYLGWDYPIEIGTNQGFTKLNFDSSFLVDFSSSQIQDYRDQMHDQLIIHKRSESPQDTSSTDQFDNPIIAKKLSHNASERVRRKKISNLYSSLRSLLPVSDQKKKLSIPGTVVRVVEYIPELQNEVEKLIRKKQDLLAKISTLQGNAGIIYQHEKPKKCIIKESNSSCSISTNKMGDNEMAIQISAFERISICEVLLLLEKNGYLVVDVSSFQTFGGRTFYNIHLWIEGGYTISFEKLNEMLLSLLEEQKQKPVFY